MAASSSSGMNFRHYVPLQEDIYKGNWDRVERFITENQEAEHVEISYSGNTALHTAIFAGRVNIVKELVNRMPEQCLNVLDGGKYTFLGYCALIGNIEMAECIIGRSRGGLSIGNGPKEIIPVVVAINFCSEIKMVEYLYSLTPLQQLSPGNGFNGATFITRAIYAKAFDMALLLLQSYPDLAIAKDIYGQTPVLALASISSAYPSANRLICWKQWIYNKTNKISELEQPHHYYKYLLRRMCDGLRGLTLKQVKNGLLEEAIVRAVKKGTVEFVKAILSACPDLVRCYETPLSSPDRMRRMEPPLHRNLFMLAVLHRQSEVFSHLCEFSVKNLMLVAIDSKNNSILHMAAMAESSARRNTVPGAAFHMQSEVRWFKEVKSVVHPFLLEIRNKDEKTPQELFTESHKELLKEGETWIKGTATACTVVGALIVTIMFAATITVPGGNDQSTGFPTFLQKQKNMFKLYIISDAVSLVSASTSLLMFLSVLTSRYAENDFLTNLPTKMIIGLSTLICSIVAMMLTFCASLFLILPKKLSMTIPLACVAGIPAVIYTIIQVRLLIHMVISTYGSRILDKKVMPMS